MIRGTSAAANKNKCEWAVRQSTAHPHFFCRALHLTPSDKKLGCGANKRKHLTPSDKKLISRDKPQSAAHPKSSNHPGLYYHVLSLDGFFCDAPHLTTSPKKFGCGANKRKHLTPSDKKLGLPPNVCYLFSV